MDPLKQKLAQIRVESGFNSINSFNMRESTPDIKVGQTLLWTLGWIRIKDGGPCSYVAQQQGEGIFWDLGRGADTVGTFLYTIILII